MNQMMSDKKRRPGSKPTGLPNIPGLDLDHILDHLPCYISIHDRIIPVVINMFRLLDFFKSKKYGA